MRALVTGGGGFIGSHLVRALRGAKIEVTVLERAANPLTDNELDVRWVCAELDNRTALHSALDLVDVVFHLAWSGIHQSSNEDPSAHARANLSPTLALLDACARCHVKRVVFLSSGGAVYGRALHLPIPEDHPTRPLSFYGVTKLVVETYLDFYWREYSLDYVILRPSVPYGEGQNLKRGQGAVGVFLNCALTGEPIRLWGGSEVARDFFYVGDLSEACLAAIRPDVKRGVYNIGGGESVTLGRLITHIEEITKQRLTVMTEPSRGFDPPAVVLDITKARENMGWEPRVSMAEGIERTWYWLKNSGHSESRVAPNPPVLLP